MGGYPFDLSRESDKNEKTPISVHQSQGSMAPLAVLTLVCLLCGTDVQKESFGPLCEVQP